jgi:hypothetical protein
MAWGVRRAWYPRTEEARRHVIPSGIRTSDGTVTGMPAADAPAIRLDELRSVANGLVVLPPDATPEAVAAAFAAAWTKLSAEPGADMRLQAKQLFSDWLKVDPEGVIRFVTEPPGALIRRGGEYLLTTLAEMDPEQACQIALKGGLDSKAASAVVLNVWGSRDPTAAMTYVATLPSHQRLAAELSALTGWAAVSGPEAFAWLESQPTGWRRDQLMNKIAVCMLQNSPVDMVRLVQQGSLPPEMMTGLRQWERQADAAQLLSTVQAALAAGGNVRELLRAFGMADWSKLEQHPAVRQHLRLQGMDSAVTGLGRALMVAAVQNAAPKDADDVARLAATFDGKDTSPFLPELLLRSLGTGAPEAGLAWALENNQPLAPLAASWAEYDARSALQSLLALPRGEVVDEAVRQILAKAAQSAPVEAMEAALQISMPAMDRARHISAAARVLARSDPAKAILGLGRIPDAPPEEVSAVLAIGGRSDANAAAAALAQIDLNTNGYIAAESLTRGWAVADPSGASEWVRTLPAGELRDGGAAGLARSVMESDPSAAFTWALEISEPGIRDTVATQAVKELKKSRSLAQIEADARLSEAAQRVIHEYWNRPDSPQVPDSAAAYRTLFPNK